MHQKFLLDEAPLIVLPSLACLVGLNEAIALQQVHYWIYSAQKVNREQNFKEGRWWVYHTYEEWQKVFPFWSIPTIKRTFQALEKEGFVLAARLSGDAWDKRKWYSIDYEALEKKVREKDCAETDRWDQIDPIEERNLILSNGSNCTHRRDQDDPVGRINMRPSLDKTPNKTPNKTTTTTQEDIQENQDKSVVVALVDQGISYRVAEELAENFERALIFEQIACLPYRRGNEPAAVLVKSIREGWSVPTSFVKAQGQQTETKRRKQETDQKRREREEQERREANRRRQQNLLWDQLPVGQQEAILVEARVRMRKRNRLLSDWLDKPQPGQAALAALESCRREILAERYPEASSG